VLNNSGSSGGGLTLTVGGDNASTIYSGALSGGGSLVKTGTGILTFGGSYTYAGTTSINAGTLLATGTFGPGGAISVNPGGTLSGTAGISRSVILASGGALAPGNGGPGTLGISGTLTLNGGGILDMNLGGMSSAAEIALTGSCSASGTTTINITALGGFGTGNYPLISGAGGISAGSFTFGSTPAGLPYGLSSGGGTLYLEVNAPTVPTGLAATPGDGLVDVSWNGTSNAASYNLKRSGTSGGTYSNIVSVTGTSYADTGLTDGMTYYYVVTAVNAEGESAASAQVSAIPAAAIGGAETSPPAMMMSGSGAGMNLAFTVQSSVAGHTYQLQTSSNLGSGSWTNIGSAQAGTGGNLILNVNVNPSTAPSGFYRILIRQ
jgi:autotransporter-associated beta strand protein